MKCINRILHYLWLSGIVSSIIVTITQFSLLSLIVVLIVTTGYIVFCYASHVNKISGVIPDEPVSRVADSIDIPKPETNNLVSAMKSKMSICPVLTEQLKAVIDQTDSAAEGLITSFMGINRQAKKQLKSVQELFGNMTMQSGGNTLSETKQELQEIQSNFAAMASFFDRSIEIVSDVVSQLSKVDEFVLKIKKIGQMTNILALNAAIEAAYTGEAGSGFKVIASEINTLSKDSNNSIVEIAEITEKLTSNVNKIKQELESVHQDTMRIGNRTDNLFSNVITKISETLQEAATKMGTIADDAEVLNKDVSNIVVSIQFQDITRQRIEHVISPLETFQNEITGIIENIEKDGNGGNGVIQLPLTTSESSLMEQYTMESEREIMRKLRSS